MPKLVIFRGDAVENEIRLAGRPVRLGRDARNDIVLDDKSVSRFHAEVRPDGDTYFVVDLKSRNGVWVNGQQAKGRTALALGAPVTLGAYELTLEDDVPTGEFDEESPLLAPRTVVNTPLTDRPDRPSRSATRASMRAPGATTKRQVLLWAGAAAAVLIILGVTFAVIRYGDRPETIVEVTNPPVLPSSPSVAIVQPVQSPAEDPTRVTIDRHLADGQDALGKGDYAAVREHATRVLELDPANPAALELRRRADAGLRAGRAAAPVPPVVEPPTEVETAGIPRRPGEAWPVYTARVEALKLNLEAGTNYVTKLSFALALARFRAVAAEAPKYQSVDLLITDTLAKQKIAFDEAMSGGEQNEKATKLRDARLWYQRAMDIDPNSTTARDKNTALLNRMIPAASRLLPRASSAAKTGDREQARRLYQEIVDSLLPGDEIRETAAKELENLKR